MQGSRKLEARSWDTGWNCYDVALDQYDDLMQLAQKTYGRLSAWDGNDNFIDACEPFGVVFRYVNRMNGPLLSPGEYNLPIPTLVIGEVGLGTTPPPAPRPVPWESGLVARGVDSHNEEHDDGIEPDNSNKSGTFAITIAQLPVVASGVNTISKDIGLFGSECI